MAKRKSKGVEVAGPSPMKEADYQAEDDHRTLTRAEEIRTDSKRMAGVRRHHRKQTRALSRMSRSIGSRR